MISRWSLAALLAVLAPGLAHGAGNVEVDGRRITGDGASNRIKLEPGSGGRVLVSGFDGTTVNGLPGVFVVLADKLIVRMEEGDDTIVLQDVGVAEKVNVHLGPGDDALQWTGGSTGNNLLVDGDDGADVIGLTSVGVGYNGAIEGGADDDDIRIEAVSAKHALSVKGGRGDDTVFATNLALRVSFHLSTIDGADQVTIEDSTFFSLCKVQLGGEDDDLTLAMVTTGDRVVLDGGPGTNVYTDGGGNRFRAGVTMEHFQQAP